MEILTSKVSRFLFAIPIGIFGLFHFMNGPAMAGMVPSFIPGGVFWVYLTGAALLAASVSLIIRKKDKLAGLLLGGLLLIFVLTIHLPDVIAGDMEKAMPNLLKDTALAGAAFMLAGMGND